jgi:2-polyprenyl-3-methyl-5-hydroxy-6-metoxy-1,4-benzoquinol methylase
MTTQSTYWNENADKFDAQVGDDGDAFRKNLIFPATLRLLEPQAGERILDVACGNGNFSRKLAGVGCEVAAFDYSTALIAHAKKYKSTEHIAYSVCDATDYAAVKALGGGNPFDKAVCNMALMDIPDIEPLFSAVYELLTLDGVFVFSLTHPCFISPGNRLTEDGMGVIVSDYMEEKMHVINGEIPQHHRPLSALLNMCFKLGFVLDGIEETTFASGATSHGVRENVPYVLILRARKIK